MIHFHIVRNHSTGVDNLTAFLFSKSNDPLKQADSSHPNWDALIEAVQNPDADEDYVYNLFDPSFAVSQALTSLSERISYDGHSILFDGDQQSGPLAEHLLRCVRADVDLAPLVNFWEKVASNPSISSRDQLFTWLQSHAFTITESGDIVGYKGVHENRDSLHSGGAFVNGEWINGQVPNADGSVITMPRSQVNPDSFQTCSHGLHVGDWSYAASFGAVVLEVRVNPRDVVSIPVDSGARKMRCCRYEVVRVLDNQYEQPVLFSEDEVDYDVVDDDDLDW